MNDRHTVDSITSDALDALYETIDAAQDTELHRQLQTADRAFASASVRAALLGDQLARARALHRETCPLAKGDLATGFTCSMCAALNAPGPAATEATEPDTWAPPPPGDTREQLPDEVLTRIRRNLTDYTSTACGLDRALVETMADNPDTVAELKPWRERMHNRCRLNHKFTGQQCGCWCHETEEQPGA